jgi:hypothetical protein
MSLSYVGVPPVAQSSGGFPSLQALLGTIQLGWDTSNNFALSLRGLAILRPDGTYVARDRDVDSLHDVTPLVLPGVNPWVLRLPVARVRPGFLLVTSDVPFSLVYVIEAEGRRQERIEGLDPISGEFVEYCRPVSLFFNYFVRVVSLFEAVVEGGKELEKE